MKMHKTVNDIQEEIIDEFSFLGDDRESAVFYMMELGNKLAPLDDRYKTEEFIVKGCQSKVWLTTDFTDGKVIFKADSNTEITKGLISMLIRIWSERTPEEIINTDLYFIDKIGMKNMVGSQRSNGFAAMIKLMKSYALAYQTKERVN
ncbi:SufE protein probably involved in Fe-S center assembly [Solitalea canadensis DSM 3403]|uniref:SufE protein probably involved in Fe-S center assembly n=2 Tax=Solitalea canadensis TaxID=995 RepID=H8KUZ5_SOLCM|nr:SufE protein probably involved in Fe-S center assembly [Solitalea canadensis DSM 3403]